MYHRPELHHRVHGAGTGASTPHVPPYPPVQPYQSFQHQHNSSGGSNYRHVFHGEASHQYTAARQQYPAMRQPIQHPQHPGSNGHGFDVNKYLPHRFNPLRDHGSAVAPYQVPVYQGPTTTYSANIQSQPVYPTPYHNLQPQFNPYATNHAAYPAPPPPPIYSHPQYANRERYQRPNPPMAPAQPKRKRFEFYCDSCSKGFECEEDFDIHVAEDHVTCSHPGCGFSAREEVVRAHKVKHSVNMDSPEELDAWIAMRRNKFPRKNAVDQPKDTPDVPLSKLEKFIRNSMRQSAIEARKKRREREQKQPCVHWERSGRCSFGDKCSFAHEKTGVCTFFLNHGRCRHGDACKYKHVRTGSRELEEIRDPRGQLMKKLMAPEIYKFQSAMLQCIRHMVNNNFYQGNPAGDEGVILAESQSHPVDDDLGSTFDDDDDYEDFDEEDEENENYTERAQLSPISNR